MNPPATHKEWASYLCDVMGGKYAVHSYLDDSSENKIPIFTSVTTDGIVAATVGLQILIKVGCMDSDGTPK